MNASLEAAVRSVRGDDASSGPPGDRSSPSGGDGQPASMASPHPRSGVFAPARFGLRLRAWVGLARSRGCSPGQGKDDRAWQQHAVSLAPTRELRGEGPRTRVRVPTGRRLLSGTIERVEQRHSWVPHFSSTIRLGCCSASLQGPAARGPLRTTPRVSERGMAMSLTVPAMRRGPPWVARAHVLARCLAGLDTNPAWMPPW